MIGELIGAGTSLLGGILGSSSAKKAAKEQAKAQREAIAEQRRQFDIVQGNEAPYRMAGRGALNNISRLYGLPTEDDEALSYQQWIAQNPQQGASIGGAGLMGIDISGMANGFKGYQNYLATRPKQASGPDLSPFWQSPDYNFVRSEGNRGVERSAAARGGAFSGNALRALDEFNSNLASSEFGNYFNRQAAIAGIGQTANQNTARAGMQTAGNIGNALMYGGDARASGVINSANAWGDALGGAAGFLGRWAEGRNKPSGGLGRW